MGLKEINIKHKKQLKRKRRRNTDLFCVLALISKRTCKEGKKPQQSPPGPRGRRSGSSTASTSAEDHTSQPVDDAHVMSVCSSAGTGHLSMLLLGAASPGRLQEQVFRKTFPLPLTSAVSEIFLFGS